MFYFVIISNLLMRKVKAPVVDAAAAEDVEARALGDPVEAADTDAAAAEEETCEKARALESLVVSKQPTLMPPPKRRPAGRLAR